LGPFGANLDHRRTERDAAEFRERLDVAVHVTFG